MLGVSQMDVKLRNKYFLMNGWIDYEKLDHVGPVNHEDFYSKLKRTNNAKYYRRRI